MNPSNWSSLPNDVKGKGFGAQRKNILMSQFSILGVFMGILHLFVDYYIGLTTAAIVDGSVIAVFLLLYLINESGAHTLTKLLMIVYLNIFIGAYAYFIPEKSSLILNYLILICGTMVGFGRSNPIARLITSLMPIALFVISAYFITVDFNEPMRKVVFTYLVINIITTGLGIAAILKFILDINYIIQDDRSRKQFELRKLSARVSDQEVSIKDLNIKLDKFVYSASHDLRAPLTSMLGLVNLAGNEFSKNDQHDYFGMMKKAIKRLDEYLEDLISFAKNKNQGLRIQKLNFQEIFDDTVDSLRFAVTEMQSEYHLELEKTAEFYSDERRIRIILSNLISNAIKYRNVDNELNRIEVIVKNHKGTFSLTIKDNGIGIEKSQQLKVFSMFHRASDQSAGSGLGLYIVKEVVESLEGNISMTSEPGAGTSITISIPNKVPEVIPLV